MSESALNALVQLFALVANASGTKTLHNAFLDSLLSHHLSPRLRENYRKQYQQYCTFFASDLPRHEDSNYNSTIQKYTQKVCNDIRKEISMSDRLWVIVKFLEFVKSDKRVTPQEESIMEAIFNGFAIIPHEAQNLKNFIINRNCEGVSPEKLVVIGNELNLGNHTIATESNRIINNGIDGRLSFLFVDSAGYFITCYSGNTLLYLDGSPITSEQVALFSIGSVIRGANIEPIYFSNLSSLFNVGSSNGIVFSANNIQFQFRNSNNGIRKFSFAEKTGQLIAVMGGSGVGKSTLMNILTGKIRPNEGVVTINGHDIHANKHVVQGIIGYVPQDDLLFENLTVYQNLFYNARLCFGNYSKSQLNETVTRVLHDLDLWDIRDLKVGSPLNKMISGGQRKRLNFGLEFMREPSILFVDEPTSGLSSSDSLMIMKLLKQQANNGKLIIINIHQPSAKVFRLLDKIWVLDKGGFPVYAGNPVDGIVYFKSLSMQVDVTESGCPQCGIINPDEILELVEAKEIDDNGRITSNRKRQPADWYNTYLSKIQSPLPINNFRRELPKSSFNIPHVYEQFRVFGIRNFLSKIANKQYVLLNILEAPILAFILAFFSKHTPGTEYVFADNKNLPAFLLMSIIVALFIGLTVSAEEIISDKKILERESFLNLSRFSYLNSKVFYLFGLSAFQMLLFVLVGNWVLEINGMFFSFWLILFTTACFANLVGLNLSAGLSSVVAIYISIPLVLVPQILLSGTIVPFDNLHPSLTRKVYVPIVGDLMASRWAYEALAVEQFKNNPFEKHFFDFEQVSSQANFRTSFLIPRLQTAIDESSRALELKNPDIQRVDRNVRLLKRELEKIARYDSIPPFEFLNNLNADSYNDEMAEELSAYLIFVRMQFVARNNRAREQRDSVYNTLVDKHGSDVVFRLKMQNYNKALVTWVLNTNDVTKFLETEDEIIPKYEAVFMIPSHNWGRAHFYAPYKKFNSQNVYTLWFNLAVLWLGIAALFVTLQFNLLGRLIDRLEITKIRFVLKREERRLTALANR